MEFSLSNLEKANDHFAGEGALYFPCKPDKQPVGEIDLVNAGPVLMVFHDRNRRYVLQWLSRVMPGIANDWEEYNTFEEVAAAVQQDILAFPELHIVTERGWIAGDNSWW